MNRVFWLAIVLSILLSGCQDLNSPKNPVNQEVQAFITRYLAAINNNDRTALKELLSNEFGGRQQVEVYLDGLLQIEGEYSGYRITNIEQAGDVLAVNVELKRELTHTIKLDPSVNVKNSLKLAGTSLEKTIMIFSKQKKLISDDRYAVMEKYSYGDMPPLVFEFYPSEMSADPGAELTYYFSIKKQRPGTMLKVLFNGEMIKGGVLDDFIYNNSHTLAVPRTKQSGKMFFVEMLVMEGSYEQSTPSAIKDISLSVRKLGIPLK